MVKLFAIAAAINGAFILNAIAADHLPISQSAGVIKTGEVNTHLAAGVRSFHSPQLSGGAVRYCSADMRQCGKNVADNFCRNRGFKEGFTFQRDQDEGDDTVGFRQIKCWYPTSPTAFRSKAGNITVLAKNQVFPILRHLVDLGADNACLDI